MAKADNGVVRIDKKTAGLVGGFSYDMLLHQAFAHFTGRREQVGAAHSVLGDGDSFLLVQP